MNDDSASYHDGINCRCALILKADENGVISKDGQAFNRLVFLLGAEKMLQLAEMVEEVAQETGYGHVTIIVSQGKVARLKAEKSY